MTKDIMLDIRGQICPACLLITLREIANNKFSLKRGQSRLVVKTDHRDATRTIPGAAVSMGYETRTEKTDGYYEITIEYRK